MLLVWSNEESERSCRCWWFESLIFEASLLRSRGSTFPSHSGPLAYSWKFIEWEGICMSELQLLTKVPPKLQISLKTYLSCMSEIISILSFSLYVVLQSTDRPFVFRVATNGALIRHRSRRCFMIGCWIHFNLPFLRFRWDEMRVITSQSIDFCKMKKKHLRWISAYLHAPVCTTPYYRV